MPRFCANCGTQMTEAASFCPNCGKAAAPAGGTATGYGAAPQTANLPPVTPISGATANTGLADNLAGMLAYVTIIPAIVFLVMEPYNRRLFVRFHAFQCLFFAAAVVVVGIALAVIPFIAWPLYIALRGLISLAELALWIVCLIKANQGQMWKIPVIGDWAEKQAAGGATYPTNTTRAA